MPPIVRNLTQEQGADADTVSGLVRAIRNVYAAVATAEGIAAPTLQFGRRYVDQVTAPPRILIVPQKGPIGGPSRMGGGVINTINPTVKAYVWGIEPDASQAADEMEMELARFDAVDPMVIRFLNVLNRVAAGCLVLLDADPDTGEQDPAAVNEYGEAYVVTFQYIQDVPKDGLVFSVLITQDSDGRPVPQVSPPPLYKAAGADLVDVDLTTTPTE